MNIEVLQNDSSVEHQRQLVAKALPELDSFMIIGHRRAGTGNMPNFASCSFSAHELANAIANFLITAPHCIAPFAFGLQSAIKKLDSDK
ncbi:MAG: hypothetical protein K2N91_08220 [Muribaculaceae bacterium]|nr:hypothetical protein [Muribaculaceae bacterium]